MADKPVDFSGFEKEINAFEKELARLDSLELQAKQSKYKKFKNAIFTAAYDTNKKFQKETIIIELNSADTTDLKKLEGIGSSFAKRIISYRNRLGGFAKKEQLLEVYGMDSTRYSEFSDFVSVNTFLITQININTATFNELKSHPYIGYNIALSLVNMRKSQGKFNAVSDIKKSVLISEKLYEKLLPYITVN